MNQLDFVSFMNQLDFVSDNLLSTNDADVIAKKRENFRDAVISAIESVYSRNEITWNNWIDVQIIDAIIAKTFDTGLVN